MKYLILLSLLIASYSNAATLNIPDGTCRGSGTLKSGLLVPDIDFTSVRVFKNGRIDATSTVSIFGFANNVTANLYFSPNPAGFSVLDLTKPVGKSYAQVGSALCGPSECAFNAKVLNGDLELREVWVVNNHGFSVRNGFQIFKGLQSHYEAEFECN